MRCVSYCTARNYQIPALNNFFKSNPHYRTNLYKDVLHITYRNKRGNMFCFPEGCVVFWGFYRHEELKLLELLKPFSISPLEKIEADSFHFRMSDETRIYVQEESNLDIIEIEAEENVPIKLAVSYGLAQSVKLASYEEVIQKTIQANERIPEQLSMHGKITLSRRAILKRMGEIFLERSHVNLSSEYLEMPEYFWQFPRLETYYLMTEKYLDVRRRARALNHKLDVLHEVFDMLNNQLQHRHSSLLEIIIILLIAFEICLTLTEKIFG